MNRIEKSAVYFKLRQEDASSAAKPLGKKVSREFWPGQSCHGVPSVSGASAADIMGMLISKGCKIKSSSTLFFVDK